MFPRFQKIDKMVTGAYRSENCFRCPKCCSCFEQKNLDQCANGTYSVRCKDCEYIFDYIIERRIFIISPTAIKE